MALRSIPSRDLPLRGFAITLIVQTTLSRTPLDECSARRRDLYLKTHNTHNRQISIPPAGYDPQSQQASGRRITPETTWSLGSAINYWKPKILFTVFSNLGSRQVKKKRGDEF